MYILIGFLIFAFGITIVLKAEWIYYNFGTIPIFEKFLRTEGGGRLGYKLIGIFIAFIGILTITGMIRGFILWVFSPLLKWIVY